MPSVVEIVLRARDDTGPAFASARANLANFISSNGQGAQTFTGVSGAASQAIAQINQMGQAQQRSTTSARTLEQAESRLAATQFRLALASTDGKGKIALLRQEVQRLEAATRPLVLSTEEYTRRMNAATSAALRLKQAENARERGLGPPLPHTFAGFTGQGILQAAGALGVATAAPEAIAQLKQMADQGQSVQVVLDGTRASLGALLGSQSRANQVMDAAARFGDKYKLTQEQTARAVQASSQIIRTSSSSVEELLSVLGRLQVMSPEQSIDEAALALKELANGDIQSLRERFEISGDAARLMKKEIEGGADAVQVLGRYLDKAGVTNGALEAGLAGAAGQQRELNRAMEDLGLTINNVVTSAGWRTFLAGLVQGTTAEIRGIQEYATGIRAAFANMLPPQVQSQLSWFAGLEERLSDAIQRYQQEKQAAQEEFLGIAQARRLATSEAKTAREDTYTSLTASAPPVAAVTAGASSPHFAGFGPASARAPYIQNIYVSGSLIAHEEIKTIARQGQREYERRNGDLGYNQ